tara:strand:- start:1165 stop:1428 length:264 start_codon:yes stop_codon:yes gene_type:complete
MGVYGHHQPTRPTDKRKPDVQLDDRHMPVNPTEHDESDEIEQTKKDELAMTLWEYRWFSLPVLMIVLYEPVYWTMLNVWCWVYGLIY